MATITWTSAVAGNWNTGANWSGGVVPGAADDVVFDGTGVGNCTLDVNATVLSVSANAGYTGAIDLGTNNLSVTGNFTLDHGGGIDFGSGTHVFSGFFDVKDCGTLDYATSSVELAGTGTNMLTWSATDANKSLYDVIVSGNLTINDVPYAAIRATNSYTISGTLTHNASGGRQTSIEAGALVVSGTLAGSGDCLVRTNASGVGSLAISGSGSVTIAKLKASVDGVTGSYVEIGAGDYSSCDVEMSTLNSSSDAPLRFSGDVTLKSLNFTASTGGDIVVQNSTHNPSVTISGNVTCTTSTVVWSAGTGTITLDNTAAQAVNFNGQTVEAVIVSDASTGAITLGANFTTPYVHDCSSLIDLNGFTITETGTDPNPCSGNTYFFPAHFGGRL